MKYSKVALDLRYNENFGRPLVLKKKFFTINRHSFIIIRINEKQTNKQTNSPVRTYLV